MTAGPAQTRRPSDAEERAATQSATEWTTSLRRFLKEWIGLIALATIALLGVAKVGEDVFAHESTSFDGAVQAWMLAHQHPIADQFFLALTTIGGVAGNCVVALVAAAYLWYHDRRRVGAAVLVAAFISVALFNIVKHIYARPRPLGLGGRVASSYSFPSGHATASAAVCCTLAYVLWREGFLGRRTALAFAVLAPLLSGISRLYLNVHWTTDVLGGWSAGLLVAVLSVALYERYHRRSTMDSGAFIGVDQPTTQSSAQ